MLFGRYVPAFRTAMGAALRVPVLGIPSVPAAEAFGKKIRAVPFDRTAFRAAFGEFVSAGKPIIIAPTAMHRDSMFAFSHLYHTLIDSFFLSDPLNRFTFRRDRSRFFCYDQSVDPQDEHCRQAQRQHHDRLGCGSQEYHAEDEYSESLSVSCVCGAQAGEKNRYCGRGT